MKKIIVSLLVWAVLCCMILSSCLKPAAGPSGEMYDLSDDAAENKKLNAENGVICASETMRILREAWDKAESVFNEGNEITVEIDNDDYSFIPVYCAYGGEYAKEGSVSILSGDGGKAIIDPGNMRFVDEDLNVIDGVHFSIRCPDSGIDGKMIIFLSILINEHPENCFFDVEPAKSYSRPEVNADIKPSFTFCADGDPKEADDPAYSGVRAKLSPGGFDLRIGNGSLNDAELYTFSVDLTAAEPFEGTTDIKWMRPI